MSVSGFHWIVISTLCMTGKMSIGRVDFCFKKRNLPFCAKPKLTNLLFCVRTDVINLPFRDTLAIMRVHQRMGAFTYAKTEDI